MGSAKQFVGWASIFMIPILVQGCRTDEKEAAEVVQSRLSQPTTQPRPDTPEGVFRAFLVAVANGDAKTIRDLTIDRPDMEVLFDPAPEEVRPLLVAMYQSAIVRRVRPGEVVTLPLPSGPKQVIYDVDEDNVVLILHRDPLPHFLLRRNGEWRYDPGALIASRKAANEYKARNAKQSE